MDGIVNYINEKQVKNIIVMTGAGISTSAGIPDFRSRTFGLYDRLKDYNLPFPEAIFSNKYFLEKPEAFYAVAKELFASDEQFQPTPAHHFIRLLNDKGILLRHYTQNVDELEFAAGLDKEKNVQAHGTIQTSTCLSCNKTYDLDWVKEQVLTAPLGVPKCPSPCGGLIKPDVVLFGDALPDRFWRLIAEDFPECDLLIIIGTSLAVAPFNQLVNQVPSTCPRLLINLSKTAEHSGSFAYRAIMWFNRIFNRVAGLKFDGSDKSKIRDVWWKGTCDDGTRLLAEKLGWKAELEALIQSKKQ